MVAEEWYFRMELAVCATNEQAEVVARRVGSVFVDRRRGRTEVATYVTATGVRQAVSDGLERVGAALMSAELSGETVAVEAKTEQERLAELAADDIPEMVGVAEIQEILGINTRQQVGQLAQRKDFPEPVAELKAGRIWRRSDVNEFRKRWRRTPGRTASVKPLEGDKHD